MALSDVVRRDGVQVQEAQTASHVGELLNQAEQEGGIWAILWRGDFSEALGAALRAVADEMRSPMLVFLDPTGYSMPFDVVRSVVTRRWSELLLTFMSGHMERWCRDPRKRETIIRTFGDDEWEPGDWESLTAQYVERIKRLRPNVCVCAYKVRHARTSRPIYHLLHISHHWKAAQIVKREMWQETTPGLTEPGYGGHRHKALRQSPRLFDHERQVAAEKLADMLLDTWAGRKVSFDELEQRVECGTIYTAQHLREALRMLEAQGYATVTGTGPRGAIRADSVIVFAPARGH
ncbi:MAG: three-Cys-motif partner protein TcmP [Armatimonadetes bacterium]|nr:three-Cys-motif partner protein TcmP [Armatimonadota bacterium]